MSYSILQKTVFTGIVLAAILLASCPVFGRGEADAEKTEVVAAVLRNWPPQYTTDKDTGKPSGFAVDIFNELAAKSNLSVRYRVFDTWPNIHEALERKDVDLVPNMGIIAERLKMYHFTAPVEAFTLSVFTRSSNDGIKELSDLAGKQVGVVNSNKGQYLMEVRGGSHLIIYHSLEELFMALMAANIDALVYPVPNVLKLAEQSGLRQSIKIVGAPVAGGLSGGLPFARTVISCLINSILQ